MATAAARKFAQSLPPEDSELEICPPGCTTDHDAKWYGVTVPKRIVPKTPAKTTSVMHAGVPLTFPKFYPPKNGEDYGKVIDPPEITAKGLERHARKFGLQSPPTIASVQDLAKMLGFKVKLPKAELHPNMVKKKKARGQSKKDQAIHLVRMGIKDWTVIEDQLNLSRPMSIRLKQEILGE